MVVTPTETFVRHPDVSVIMPTFNAQAYVGEAIASVLAQTLGAWELLVIDDGSTDSTVSVVDELRGKDARIKLLRTKSNSGPAEARNVGIAAARGQYIAFLDSDDVWFPQKLAHQLSVMSESGAAFCCAAYRILRDNQITAQTVHVPPVITYSRMLRGSVIGCLTVVYDTRILGKCRFDDGRSWIDGSIYRRWINKVGHEDYALWLHLLRTNEQRGVNNQYRFVGIDEPLAAYRVHDSSFSSSKKRAALYQWIIYRRSEKLGLLRSLYYFLQYAMSGVTKNLLRRSRHQRDDAPSLP